MKRLQLTVLALLTSSVAALAQAPFEGGLKGGATFTHGHTTIPSVPISASAAIPQLNNTNNGIGTSYSFGIWGRRNFSKFYVQVEVDYSQFVLKQKTDFSVSAGLAAALAGLTLPSAIPAQTPASIHTVSESTLGSVTIPILFGKRWGNFRAFIGPNLLFTTKAEAKRTDTATILSLVVTNPETTSDLKNPNPQSPTETILKVKPFTYAAEAGVGYTFFRRFDLDARYAVPVGGIYKNKDITGYLGIATLSLGVRLF